MNYQELMKPVISSNIAELGYDVNDEIVYVRFSNGALTEQFLPFFAH